MKISTTMKKIMILLVAFYVVSCGIGGDKKSSENKQESKNETISTENVTKNESYEQALTERMTEIEEKIQKDIDSGENMLGSTFDLEEIWKEEYNKIYELLSSKLSDGEKIKFENDEKTWFEEEENRLEKETLEIFEGIKDRDYEMVFSSKRSKLVKIRTLDLAKKYDELNK